jgi:outer membrane receptor protein involved in Fe transport
VRKFIGALVCSALCVTSIVGPVSAATTDSRQVAQANTASGTLTGTIIDSRGQSLPNAQVIATSTGSNYTTTSGKDGRFTLAVPAGVYSVVVNKGGFQGSQSNGVAVAASTSTSIVVTMTEASSTSLTTIGRTSSNVVRNPINNGVTATSTLGSATIQDRANSNLSDIVPELPGVTLSRTTGATANTFFVARGAYTETRVNIDGHPLSSGTFGNWNSNYAIANIFDSVEVVKGAGLNGPTAGESAIGTINLRTPDFFAKNGGRIELGVDGYQGSSYLFLGGVNTLNDKIQIVAGKAFSGYRGPQDGYLANRQGAKTATPLGTFQAPIYTGLDQWYGDLTNRYTLEGEIAKIRFNFTDSTSLSFSYLGLQGQYGPQGGAYASFNGYQTIAQCFNGSTPGAGAQCTNLSAYNPPYATSAIGTQVPVYNWFPNSVVQNSEPQFSAEFRTSIKNDTLLIRPYTAQIYRFIDGSQENKYAGNGGGWFQVTNAANCQVAFVAASAANGGAKGPCFGAGATITDSGYVGNDTKAHHFQTTGVAPTCSVANPCYTTSTQQGNNGEYGYGGPFSQPELDRLRGVTFQYFHPVGDNQYGFSYDFNREETASMTGDTGIPPAGCTATVGGGGANTAANAKLGYQPTCPLNSLPRSPINIPDTIITKNDLALTAQLQLTPKLQFAFGNYFTNYKAQAQTQDTAVLAKYAAALNQASAPVALIPVTNNYSHYDPHFGFNYRLNRDASLRFTAGSSITTPYASQISGFGSVDLPNGANNNTYTLTNPNPALKPETTVAYNLGGDFRLNGGALISIDGFDNAIHDAFVSNRTLLVLDPATQALYSPTSAVLSSTQNVSLLRSKGLEFGIARTPAVGFGYVLSTTFQRAYLDQLPSSIYAVGRGSTLVNLKQLDGSVNGQASIPYSKGYAQLQYAGAHNSLVTLGADYEGSNNSTYGPAYVLYNSTIKFEVAPQTSFKLAIDNLLNLSTGSALGRSLNGQGSEQLQATVNAAGQVVPFTAPPRFNALQQINFRTYRFLLTKKF